MKHTWRASTSTTARRTLTDDAVTLQYSRHNILGELEVTRTGVYAKKTNNKTHPRPRKCPTNLLGVYISNANVFSNKCPNESLYFNQIRRFSCMRAATRYVGAKR